ncbi:CHAT domain-containing protein [Gymnopilus junonius]|uniref:CHAT domain-containing protein n=1 Tax=Gymnopilus junonius TaxID=109634 RepID=A0A9P5NH49_GYMJU|nr:CHAT domain-containing protein [Gymnopilus junonius]
MSEVCNTNRIYTIKDIVVECSSDDRETSAIDGLVLSFMDTTTRPRLDLTRTSASTWKQENDMYMLVPEDGILVLLSSESTGDMGHAYIDTINESFHVPTEDSILPGNRLEQTFEQAEGAPTLSISCKIYTFELDRILRKASKGHIDPLVLYNVVQQMPEDNPMKIYALHFCGEEFVRVSRMSHNELDLRAAIKAYQDTAERLSPDDQRFVACMNDIGLAYSKCFKITGKAKDAEAGISALQQVLATMEEEHTSFLTLLCNLGSSLSDRFQSTGTVADVSEAIHTLQRVVNLTSDDDPELPSRLTNLGNAFLRRFDHIGQFSDSSEAIRILQHAISIAPEGHENLPAMLANLGNVFSSRFEHTGDLSDISESIVHRQHGLQLTPDGHEYLPAFLTNLGLSFSSRFQATGDVIDISEAILLHQRALQSYSDRDEYLIASLTNLAKSLSLRFLHTGEIIDISEAIQAQRRACSLTPNGHPEIRNQLNNLASLLTIRFELSKEPADLSEAIQAQQHAVSLTPEGHIGLPGFLSNLGRLFFRRYESHNKLIDISEAIRFMQKAADLTRDGHPRLPYLLHTLGISYLCRFQLIRRPTDISQAAELMQRSFHLTPNGHPELSIRANNLGRLYMFCFEISGQTELFNLSLSAYRQAARIPTGPPSMSMMAAKKWAELSKMSLASPSELLEAHEHIIHLLSLNAGLENTFRRRHELLINSSQSSTAAAAVALSADQLDKALEWLEQGQLENAGSRADSSHQDGLLSMDTKISLEGEAYKHLKLAKERDELLKTIRNIPGFDSFLRPKRCDPPQDDVRKLLHTLWADLVEPILQALAIQVPDDNTRLPRIWWCPTGPFAFLPIHAAGIYYHGKSTPGTCLADFAVSSYIPTLSTLTRLRSRDDPCTTKKGILLEITNPLESGIHLYDGPLKLSEIMKKNLANADLAFMSACQTSTGDENLPEEVVHLAAGMLAAGYRSVVATMWSISDQHAPQLAETFYENLLNNDESEVLGGAQLNGKHAARALHVATRRLRERLGDSTEALLAWIPYIHVGI